MGIESIFIQSIAKHLPRKSRGEVDLFLFRDNGQEVTKDLIGHSKNTTSVGVLVSGLWQAATEVLKLREKDKSQDTSFRLQFDSANSGLIIYPAVTGGESFYLVAHYEKVINPGMLKNRVRKIRDEVEYNYQPKKAATEGFSNPFSDITDDEIESMFSFARN